MNCRLIANDLAPYLVGELDAIEEAAVEAHVESCAACRDELCRTEAMLDLIRRGAAEVPRRSPRPQARVALRVAAVVVAFVGGMATRDFIASAPTATPSPAGANVIVSVHGSQDTELVRAHTRPNNGLARGLLMLGATSVASGD